MADNTFAVTRQNLRELRAYDDGAGSAPLTAGQARLKVGLFAITSNNVTYGKLGEMLRYFAFFPAPEASEGRIPAWGFADVVESNADGLEVGARVFGFLPMSSHLVVEPTAVGPGGFTDGAAHRADLPPFYNRYQRTDTDPGYAPDHEAVISLLRPLFGTAFLLSDHLLRSGLFGAEQVVLASASSKTAFATAFELSRRGASRVLGLTSPKNRAFVEGLGVYDAVFTYDEAASLPAGPTVLVDMAGSASVRAAVHTRYGADLKHSAIIGATHWDAPRGDGELPGPKPEVFFAPSVAGERMKEWGPAEMQRRMGEAWMAFMAPVTHPDRPWVRVVQHEGLDGAMETFRRFLDGGIGPDEGHVVRW